MTAVLERFLVPTDQHVLTRTQVSHTRCCAEKETPYSLGASEALDMIYNGGKSDDITVVVARLCASLPYTVYLSLALLFRCITAPHTPTAWAWACSCPTTYRHACMKPLYPGMDCIL